jgi:hypothetical protein
MLLIVLLSILLPNPATTPGVLNPSVNQGNLAETVCRQGWTKTVRPPARYTNRLKQQQMKALGLRGKRSSFEEDHWLPLELGGDPRDPRNLYPQPWPEARRKDVVETALHREVCAGRMTLREAQDRIRRWPEELKVSPK